MNPYHTETIIAKRLKTSSFSKNKAHMFNVIYPEYLTLAFNVKQSPTHDTKTTKRLKHPNATTKFSPQLKRLS